MNEYYENGPEGMPRVKRMTDSTIMAVLSQKNVPTIYVHSEQDYASLRLFAHAIAEETLARVPAWPAERTTSPDRKSCCAHDSDCAVHNAPALPVGPCDCSLANAEPQAQAEPVAFDADDLPRYDVQDGRMAREMDGRFVKLSDVRAAMKGKP